MLRCHDDESIPSMLVACFCSKEGLSEDEISASARFFDPLLCVVKMSALAFEGRARPLVEAGGWERRELRVLEKREVDGMLEVEVDSLGLRVP